MKTRPEDVDLKLSDELLHFHLHVRQSQKLTEEHTLSVSYGDLYQIMCKQKIYTAFSNVEAIFKLFLSLIATNCSGDRSFSRLRRIKNELRSTMPASRVVCTEHSVQ